MPGYPDLCIHDVVLTGCWYIWWMRRQVTHEGAVPPVNKCALSILAITSNYSKTSAKVTSVVKEKWVKPAGGCLKLNVDASYHAEDGTGATGAVLRDSSGTFLAGRSRFIPYAASAQTMEVMALRDGLLLANEVGCNRLQAESDCMGVIDALSGTSQWYDQAAPIYASCTGIARDIGLVNFMHCHREANVVAHELARFCFSQKVDCIWHDEAPSFILQFLLNDVNIL